MSLYPTNLESSYSGVSTMAFNQIQFQHGMSIPEFLRCPEVRPAAFLLISVPPIMVSAHLCRPSLMLAGSSW
jgi:hypothetical protein